MNKPVTSSNPMKPAAVAAIKAAAGATKVTDVKQHGPTTFSGHAFAWVDGCWRGGDRVYAEVTK